MNAYSPLVIRMPHVQTSCQDILVNAIRDMLVMASLNVQVKYYLDLCIIFLRLSFLYANTLRFPLCYSGRHYVPTMLHAPPRITVWN